MKLGIRRRWAGPVAWGGHRPAGGSLGALVETMDQTVVREGQGGGGGGLEVFALLTINVWCTSWRDVIDCLMGF